MASTKSPVYCLETLTIHCYPTSSSTNDQVVFNNLLRSARNPIECAFGRLKARWQILNRRVDLKFEHLPELVYSCLLLHNFCEVNGVDIDDDHVRQQIEYDKEIQPNVAPDRIFSYNSAGVRVRDIITKYINEHLPHHQS